MPARTGQGGRDRSDHALADLAVGGLEPVGRAHAALRVDRVRIGRDMLLGRLHDLEAAVGLALADLGLEPGVEVLLVDPDLAFRRDVVLDRDAARIDRGSRAASRSR